MHSVCVVYEETRNGRNALQMAASAARRLGDGTFTVFVSVELVDKQDVPASLQRAREAVVELVGTDAHFELKAIDMLPKVPQNALLVLPRASKPAEDGGDTPPRLSESFAAIVGAAHGLVDVLMPADEVGLDARGEGPLLVPFSDGESGLVAATSAIRMVLAQRQKNSAGACSTTTAASSKTGSPPNLSPAQTNPTSQPEVIFYHTTWTDERANSPDAIDQMCVEATRVMLAIEAAATKAGIRFRTIVETHDDVVQGVIEMAQEQRATLVVMARGARIRQGSYVGRTLQQSSVPVFIASTQTPYVAMPAQDEAVNAHRARRRELLASRDTKKERKPLLRRIADSSLIRNPMFVAAVVALAYMGKAAAKIGVGSWINSPMVTGDGFHNIADVLEVIAIGIVLFIAARQASAHYPYGRKNMEWFTQLGIGIGLFAAAGNFIVACCVGLLSYAPALDAAIRHAITFLPQHQPVTLNSHTFPWVLAVTAVSFGISLVLSRYQIYVGKKSGHASLIANGEEAASDGWIECVTVFGIIAEYVTGWGFLEYVLGLVVALMIMRTAKELFVDGWRVLLQHSIGADHEEAIRRACASVRGVSAVADLKTFQVGHTAVVMVTCETLAGSHGTSYIKKGVECAIRAYLVHDDSDFKGSDIHVKMQRPDPRRHRVGYGLVLDPAGTALLATREADITHVAVCDVEHGDIVRSKVLARWASIGDMCAEKRMNPLYVFEPDASDSNLAAARTRELRTLGLTV